MRGAFTASGSGVEPGLYFSCQLERERVARGKNNANIVEIIADRGFWFHSKVE